MKANVKCSIAQFTKLWRKNLQLGRLASDRIARGVARTGDVEMVRSIDFLKRNQFFLESVAPDDPYIKACSTNIEK